MVWWRPVRKYIKRYKGNPCTVVEVDIATAAAYHPGRFQLGQTANALAIICRGVSASKAMNVWTSGRVVNVCDQCQAACGNERIAAAQAISGLFGLHTPEHGAGIGRLGTAASDDHTGSVPF